MPTLSETISHLNVYDRERRAFIKARVRLENMAAARVRSLLGYDPAISGEAEEGVKKRAHAFVAAIAKDEAPKRDADIAAQAYDFVAPVLMPIPLLKKTEAVKVKHMEKLARDLPPEVLAYINSPACKGFGLRGLAVITAICHGDTMQGFADFATVAKVWKRCGLNSHPSIEEKQMYKVNRAQCFAFIYDPVVRQQWASEKDGVAAHATGPYGELYGEAKARYMQRLVATADLAKGHKDKWTPKRADLAARRYMAKRLLRNLWQVWRGTGKAMLSGQCVSRAETLPTRREVA